MEENRVGSRDGALSLGKSCFVRAMLSYAQAVRDFVTAMRNFVAALRIREPDEKGEKKGKKRGQTPIFTYLSKT